MNCDLCSTPIPEGASKCPECGKKVEAAMSPPPPQDEHLKGGTRIVRETRSVDAMLEPGAEFAGRYRIDSQIGSGGMGTVYLAEDTVTTRKLALKLIKRSMLADEGAADRLIAEGLVTRDIQHPNVVNVYDVAKAGEQPYLTMEHIEGTSLRAWLGAQVAKGEVPVETVVGIVNSILDGLQAAHAQGVVHRDLKPENVILLGEPNEGDFRLKILDFGIAKAVSATLLSASISSAGDPLYMAPEQRTSLDTAGPSADLYALSRMFYELLMEALPDAMWQAPSADRADVPKGIDALIQRGLSNRPRSRQQSVEEYREELVAAFGTDGPMPDREEEERQRREEEERARREEAERQKREAEERKKKQGGSIFNKDEIEKRVDDRFKTGGKWDAKKIGMVVGIGLLAALAVSMFEGEDPPPPEPPRWSQNEILESVDPVASEERGTLAERLAERLQERDSEIRGKEPVWPEDEPEEPDIFGMSPTVGGIWYTDRNTKYTIRQNGPQISGTAWVSGQKVTLEGALYGGAFTATETGPGTNLSQLSGSMTNNTHIQYQGFDTNGRKFSGTFHINHRPGSE